MSRKPFPSLKIEHWPERDRRLWQKARQASGPFDDDGLAARWRPATLRGCERGYGVWLRWLEDEGKLDPLLHPCDRISRERIKAFLDGYRVGRAESTAAGMLRDIAYVLRACAPPDGAAWLTKLAHRMVNTARPSRPKLPRMARVRDIIALSDSLMNEGLEKLRSGKRSGAQLYRDGLIIGLLISRPWRRCNLADLRLGRSVFIDDLGVRVSIPKEETKKGIAFHGYMPKRLEPALFTYLDMVRPVLLKGAADNDGWLWISRRGGRLPANDISIRVTRTMRKHFGRDLSPHLFRDCAATEVALEDPAHIGITKAILGHATLASSQKSYNQATSFTAFSRYRDVVRRFRDED